MKLKELLEKNLVSKTLNGKYYKCNTCNDIVHYAGIVSHYVFRHDKESEEYKIKYNTLSERSKKNWKDLEYREKTSKSIKDSRTEEYCQKMSENIKEVHSRPESKTKSKEFSEKSSKNVTQCWKDEDFIKVQHESRLKSWENNNERREEQSERSTKNWESQEHIDKVIEGKIKNLEKNPDGYRRLGKVSLTKKGTYCESNFEKEVFEYLEDNNILFEDHRSIPDSSKTCDLVINDIWIELDGLGSARKDFDKTTNFEDKIIHLQHLKEQEIISDYKIITSIKEFKNWLEVFINV